MTQGQASPYKCTAGGGVQQPAAATAVLLWFCWLVRRAQAIRIWADADAAGASLRFAMSFVCVPVEWSGGRSAPHAERLESSVPLPWERLPASAACRAFRGFSTVFFWGGCGCGFSGSEELLLCSSSNRESLLGFYCRTGSRTVARRSNKQETKRGAIFGSCYSVL
jgi:hypothetical protein